MAAALQCEICGGKLIGKPGGIFECDSCGMEYSTEWARAKIQEIRGTVKVEGTVEVTGKVQVEGGATVESLLKRGFMALEDSHWDEAKSTFNRVLDAEPENADACLSLAMAEAQCKNRTEFASLYLFPDSPVRDRRIIKQARMLDAEIDRWLSELDKEYMAGQEKRSVTRDRIAPAQKLISSGLWHRVGLMTDGTVMAEGMEVRGQCDVSGWKNIVAVAAGSNHTVGLRSDGSVVATRYKAVVSNGVSDYCGQCDVSDWRDIVAISAGVSHTDSSHTVGLRSDGTVIATCYIRKPGPQYPGGPIITYRGQCDVDLWKDITAVSAGGFHTVGLRSDGTVVAVGWNNNGQCNVTGWKNIEAVSAGGYHTIGLRSNGTVAAVGNNDYGQCNVNEWKDIVSVSAGGSHSLGLRSDGTVVAAGDIKSEQCNVSGWKSIVAIHAGSGESYGIQSDGIVVAAGDCLSGWKLFNGLDTLEEERRAAAEKAEAERKAKIEALNKEKASLEAELPTLKGLFSGKRRREIEERLAQINAALKRLG